MTKRFHDIEEHHPLQPIPWNAEEEEALFCEESLQLLWKMELGVSMTNNNISSGIQNKPKNILSNEDDCPKAVKNASPTFSVFNSFNKQSHSRHFPSSTCTRTMSVCGDYVDFSSTATCLSTSQLENVQYDQIVGERLDAIMLHGGAKCNNDVVLLKKVVNNDAFIRNHNQMNFVNKLMNLLDDDPDAGIITWLPHGRSFIVHDKYRFVKEIMPMYFNSTRYKSFQRQLNMWGFQRISGPVDTGAYYHQLFLRGIPALSFLIQRKNSFSFTKCDKHNERKRTGRPFSNPDLEPDFYLLSKLRPLPV